MGVESNLSMRGLLSRGSRELLRGEVRMSGGGLSSLRKEESDGEFWDR